MILREKWFAVAYGPCGLQSSALFLKETAQCNGISPTCGTHYKAFMCVSEIKDVTTL